MKVKQNEKTQPGRGTRLAAKEGEAQKSPWTDYRSDC